MPEISSARSATRQPVAPFNKARGAQIGVGFVGPEGCRVELRGVFEPAYWHWLVNRRMVATTTAVDYLRSIHHVARYAGVLSHLIGSYHLEAFLSDPFISWNTKSLRLISVRMWHRWGAERGHWNKDPELLDIRLPRKPRKAQPALDLDQARLLLGWARTPLEKRVVYSGLYAGLRPAEIKDLSPNQWTVAFSGEQILTVQGKATSPEREVPVHPFLAPLRDVILSISPSRRQVLRTADRIRAELGIPGFETRWLRRTFARAHRQLGTPQEVIGFYLGHSPSSVTEDPYAPVTLEEAVRHQRKLTYGVDQLPLW